MPTGTDWRIMDPGYGATSAKKKRRGVVVPGWPNCSRLMIKMLVMIKIKMEVRRCQLLFLPKWILLSTIRSGTTMRVPEEEKPSRWIHGYLCVRNVDVDGG